MGREIVWCATLIVLRPLKALGRQKPSSGEHEKLYLGECAVDYGVFSCAGINNTFPFSDDEEENVLPEPNEEAKRVAQSQLEEHRQLTLTR